MKEFKVLEPIEETIILGKKIVMYGTIENPLFNAKDVAEWIEERDGYTVARKVDNDEKVIHTICVSGQNRETTMLTEDGLYEACFNSRKAIAKQMKKEIKQYLKQIRLTGGYIPIQEEDDEKVILSKALQIMQRTIEEKDVIISSMQHKADTYDDIMDSKNTFDMNAVAKLVGMGEYKLFEYLRNKGILFYNSNEDNIPYEKFKKAKYFDVIDTIAPNGEGHCTTRVYQKGIDYIRKQIRKDHLSEVSANA